MDKSYGTVACCRCGAEVPRAASTQKYCKNCAAKIKRERDQARRADCQHLGLASCAMCGGEFVKRAANQRYCSYCAPIHMREAAKQRAAKAAHRPEQSVVCVRCGTVFRTRGTHAKYCSAGCLEAARAERDAAKKAAQKPNARVWMLGRIAAANGMSYGYLMAAIEANGGSIPTHMQIPEDCKAVSQNKPKRR